MKKIGLILSLLCLAPITVFSQFEEVGPIMGNPHLQMKAKQKQVRANAGTFDSTFIYTSDTLGLPFFDEFSTNKFQVYEAGISDIDSSQTIYRCLDLTNSPLPLTIAYSSQQTYRITVDVANSSTVQTELDTIQIKMGDLSSYPVTYITTDVYPPYTIYDTLDFVNDEDTVWMVSPDIFQDSATQLFTTIDSAELIWLDDYAYHNYSMAVDPWSLGVVTFDGLDENGFPYFLGSTITNYADFLTSKPIDMAAVSVSDSVYFSFLYQAEGYCDPPESIDSLVLEFYAKDLDQWNRIWSTEGVALAEFEHVHIPVVNTDYFKKGFQFRFKNYGGLSGSLDHFHIDYVNLRELSGYQDTIIRDLAFSYPLYTLLDEFTSVPWDHYKNNFTDKMSSNVQVVVRNSSNAPQIELDGTTEIKYNSVNEGNFVLRENLLNNGDLNYLPMTTYYSFHDFSGADVIASPSGDRFDETKLGLTQEFELASYATSTTDNSYTINDSTFTKQEFVNYYSYDDGTAEQAYGPTGEQSMLAIQYTPYEDDSLIGAMIHFVPTVNDVSNNLFLLTVWDDNGGEPGNVIYEDDIFFPRQPNYEYDRNIFTTYYTIDTQKVAVNGTFYIGWRQFDAERLGVGLDKNIVNNDKTFYSTDFGNSWNSSSITGSVMIRPIFSTSYDVVLGLEEEKTEKVDPTKALIYPNPTSNSVSVRMENGVYEGAEVFNIQGVKVLETESSAIDLSNQPNGVYFFRVNGYPETYKVIKH